MLIVGVVIFRCIVVMRWLGGRVENFGLKRVGRESSSHHRAQGFCPMDRSTITQNENRAKALKQSVAEDLT